MYILFDNLYMFTHTIHSVDTVKNKFKEPHKHILRKHSFYINILFSYKRRELHVCGFMVFYITTIRFKRMERWYLFDEKLKI